jgi:hypothetical protein
VKTAQLVILFGEIKTESGPPLGGDGLRNCKIEKIVLASEHNMCGNWC